MNILLNKRDTLPRKLLDIWDNKSEETMVNFLDENFTEIKLGNTFIEICTNLHSYVDGMLINSIQFKQ